MTQNQYDHYMSVVRSGQTTRQRDRVLTKIHYGCTTLVEIKNSLFDIKMSSVSGRVSELLDEGMIKETKPGVFVPVMSHIEADMLSKQRSDARYRKWCKQGEENGYFKQTAIDFFQS